MPRKSDDKQKREQRAADLRTEIAELAEGKRPKGTKPSPREFTDAAAREAWLAKRRKKPRAP